MCLGCWARSLPKMYQLPRRTLSINIHGWQSLLQRAGGSGEQGKFSGIGALLPAELTRSQRKKKKKKKCFSSHHSGSQHWSEKRWSGLWELRAGSCPVAALERWVGGFFPGCSEERSEGEVSQLVSAPELAGSLENSVTLKDQPCCIWCGAQRLFSFSKGREIFAGSVIIWKLWAFCTVFFFLKSFSIVNQDWCKIVPRASCSGVLCFTSLCSCSYFASNAFARASLWQWVCDSMLQRMVKDHNADRVNACRWKRA